MSWLTHLSIKRRLLFIIAFALACLGATAGYYQLGERETLTDARKHELKLLVMSAHSMVQGLYDRSVSGELDEDTAKQEAMKILDSLRYAQSGYFMLLDTDGNMINHPTNAKLTGQNVMGLKDANGKSIIRDAINKGRQSNGGYTYYVFPKPGSDAPVPKITYSREFEPWNWVLSTGVYVDNIDETFWENARRSLMVFFVIAAIMGSISFITVRSIVNPVNNMISQFSRVAETKDLTVRMPVEGSRELCSLAKAFNELIVSFHESVDDVQNSSTELLTHVRMLTDAAENISNSSNQQHEATTSIAATVEQFSVSVDNLSRNADEMRELAHGAGEQSKAGSSTMNETVGQMQHIAESVRDSSEIIAELGTLSGNIQEIINVIQSVAEQTNLLALNAAIEAARAGDQGRGFAVVADEVRQLAARTAESSGQISSTIGQIQGSTQNAMDNMSTGVTKVDEGLSKVNETDQVIRNLQASSTDLIAIIDRVSSSLSEQTNASNEMAGRVTDIAKMAETNRDIASQTREAIRQLNDLAEHLEENTARFKLG
ncbi:MAG: methyl-accepting chemotaxis protein [Cellvibrionaceae bacterium]